MWLNWNNTFELLGSDLHTNWLSCPWQWPWQAFHHSQNGWPVSCQKFLVKIAPTPKYELVIYTTLLCIHISLYTIRKSKNCYSLAPPGCLLALENQCHFKVLKQWQHCFERVHCCSSKHILHIFSGGFFPCYTMGCSLTHGPLHHCNFSFFFLIQKKNNLGCRLRKQHKLVSFSDFTLAH